MSEPRRIANYQVERRLSVAGPMEVFLCRSMGPGAMKRPVVIKRLQPHLATEQAVATFLEEARLAAKLDHSNIPQIFDTDLDVGGVPFTVMEFVDGPTVAQIILCACETGELPLTRVVDIFAGAAQALRYAHEAQIVHRDVSTDNIRVGVDGVTKLLDFGPSRLSPTMKSKTRFTSPELLRDPLAKAGPPADVFSLGVCLYLATTGAWPFNGENDEAIKAAVMRGHYRKPSELIEGFPLGLEEPLCRALANEPDQRPDAGALAQSLEAWLATTGERMTQQELGEWIHTHFLERYNPAASPPPEEGQAATPEQAAPPLLDPFAPAPGVEQLSDYTAVDVSVSELTRVPLPGPQPYLDATGDQLSEYTAVDVNVSELSRTGPADFPFNLDPVGGQYTSADVAMGDLDSQPPDPGSEQLRSDLAAGDGEEPLPPRRRARRTAVIALSLLASLAAMVALAAGAISYRARRALPPPPTEAQLFIDMARRGILANNPSLAREMIDRARALHNTSPSEFIALATLEDATQHARRLKDAELAISAGDFPLAIVKLDQIEKSLPNSAEARVLRELVETRRVAPAPSLEAPGAALDAGAPELEPEALAVLEPVKGKASELRLKKSRTLLSVKSEPAGATVFVDGARVGETPLTSLAVQPGAHRLALLLQGFERHEVPMSAFGGKPLGFSVKLIAMAVPRAAPRLKVTASVPARVSIDGKVVGTTPLESVELEPGRHVLVASAEGHESVTRELELQPGENLPVALELTALPVAAAPEPLAVAAREPPARRVIDPEGPISSCPEGAELLGDAPPAGLALWCALPSGVRSGRSVRWHANGRKAEEGEFVNGKKNGPWVEYFETGAERERKSWRRGVRSW